MHRLFLVFLTFLISNSVTAEDNNDENCFYAISSIRYHLDNLTEYAAQEDQEHISLTSDEISALWSQAEHSSLAEEVALAKKYYYKALTENEIGEFNRNLYKSQEILEDIWVELNEEFFEEERNWSEVDWATDSFDPYLKKDVSNDIFREIKPFQLPSSHPAKPILDEIFEDNYHILRNIDTFTDAGFITLFQQPLSHVIVAKHPHLRGYLVKAYLDSKADGKNTEPGWKWLVRRCMGAENIRKLIQKKGLKHFSVPDKWIYMTNPKRYSPARQNIILLVTDMNLVSKEKTREAWKTLATKEVLNELYCIFSHGYSSCWLIANIPYTKDGKFSCIDTEYPKRKLNYEKARQYFNEEMQAYWDLLIRTGGNPEAEQVTQEQTSPH